MKAPNLFKRTLAYFIDTSIAFGIAMVLIQLLLLYPFRESWGIDEAFFKDPWNMELYVLLTISLPIWMYFTLLESSRVKGTLGKKWLKIQVENTDGSKLTFAKAFVRTLLKLLPWELAHIGVIFPTPMYYLENPNLRALTMVGIILFIIYFLSIWFSKKSRAVYDVALGVRVVNATP
jgi:uncharacterized RDD family membrane protein YckC